MSEFMPIRVSSGGGPPPPLPSYKPLNFPSKFKAELPLNILILWMKCIQVHNVVCDFWMRLHETWILGIIGCKTLPMHSLLVCD